MATEPALMQPEYAWLYCRADQQHDVNGNRVLDIYAMMFANQEPARAYYAEQGWDFDEVELMFLPRRREGAGALPGNSGAELSAARRAIAARQGRATGGGGATRPGSCKPSRFW